MQAKEKEKQKAIALRKQAKTYSEILKEVPVSKSTLSMWLCDVGLAKKQQQRITAKKRAAQLRGSQARHKAREQDTATIYQQASKEIGRISKRELMLIGTALYWAEGSKEKPHLISQPIDFGNTDPVMIRMFLRYLIEILEVNPARIKVGLYIHENHKHRVEDVSKYWESVMGVPKLKISYVHFKKHHSKTVRRKTDDTYYGTVRIYVRKSSSLQRKIQGWIYGITGEHSRVV